MVLNPERGWSGRTRQKRRLWTVDRSAEAGLEGPRGFAQMGTERRGRVFRREDGAPGERRAEIKSCAEVSFLPLPPRLPSRPVEWWGRGKGGQGCMCRLEVLFQTRPPSCARHAIAALAAHAEVPYAMEGGGLHDLLGTRGALAL